VSRDLREVGILRIAWLLQAGYEWSRHYEVAIAPGVPAAVLLGGQDRRGR
jgi:alkylhydroperoxidase family enzyme